MEGEGSGGSKNGISQKFKECKGGEPEGDEIWDKNCENGMFESSLADRFIPASTSVSPTVNVAKTRRRGRATTA